MFRFWIFLLLPFYSFSQGIIVGDTASSSVLYFNIKDTLLQSGSGLTYSVNFDLDNDNTYDISFLRSNTFSPSFYGEVKSVKALTNVQFAYIGDSLIADTLSPGSLINDVLNWKSGSIILRSEHQFAPPPLGPGFQAAGQFDTGSKYLGFRIIFPTDTVYGWFNLQLPSYTIKSYAYEKKCSVFCCNTLTDQDFEIYPNPTSEFINIRTSNNRNCIDYNQSKMQLLDCSGRSVLYEKYSETIDIRFVNSGMYILQIKYNLGLINKKIIIQH